MHSLRQLLWMAGAVLLTFGIASPIAVADDISGFYAGKRVTLYVGYGAGGAYDRYSRALARHMGRHIPGNPAVVVRNRPGAASIILADEVYGILPQDGTVIAGVGRDVPTEPLFGTPDADYDGRRFHWLGSMNNEVTVCAVWHTVPVRLWQDLIDRGAIMGGIGAGADSDIFPLVLNNLFGTRIRLVTGYPGGSDIERAMQRGGVEGRCAWPWSSVKSTRGAWLRDGRIRILVQMSTVKHPDLASVPLVTDFARTRAEQEALTLILARQLWARPYMVGPRVPRARVEALRRAFASTMEDARFLADAGRRKLAVAWVDGETLQKTVAEIYGFPADVVQMAAKAQAERSNTPVSRAVIPVRTAPGRITGLDDGGRNVAWEGDSGAGTLRVSRVRTTVMIDGAKAGREALKVGMDCKFTYRGSAARKIDCDG